MESDDGAVSHVFLYLGQYLASVQSLAVVTGYEVPHYNGVSMAQYHILSPSHPAVGRAEQIAFDERIGLVGILQIVVAEVFESSDVIESVFAGQCCSGEVKQIHAYIDSCHANTIKTMVKPTLAFIYPPSNCLSLAYSTVFWSLSQTTAS